VSAGRRGEDAELVLQADDVDGVAIEEGHCAEIG